MVKVIPSCLGSISLFFLSLSAKLKVTMGKHVGHALFHNATNNREPWNSGEYNIVYMKIFKSYSSTTAGIARRLAAKSGLSGVFDRENFTVKEPGVYANHESATRKGPRILELRMRTFLFSFVRDPAERCLSAFFFFKKKADGNSEQLISELKRCSNYGSKYLSGKRYPHTASDIIEIYDFIGIASAQQYDASIVALAHILQRPLSHVLYLPAKINHGTKKKSLKQTPLKVQEYAACEEFLEQNREDFNLIHLADLSIQEMYLREAILTSKLSTFKSLQNKVASKCADFAYEEGTGKNDYKVYDTNCYWRDNGCGYKCFDLLFDE